MNESRQTVETDTLWLSKRISNNSLLKNIRALNFRKPDIYENIVTTKISRSTVLFDSFARG